MFLLLRIIHEYNIAFVEEMSPLKLFFVLLQHQDQSIIPYDDWTGESRSVPARERKGRSRRVLEREERDQVW